MISQPFLLSSTGSDRATAYSVANKVVTRDGMTHVVWLDSILETGVTIPTVCARTFRHDSRTWEATRVLGVGVDNHTNPCLSCDRDGTLRLIYGPHSVSGGPHADGFAAGYFKYAIADTPGTLEGLQRHGAAFGYHATYASLLHGANGSDYLVYRGGELPWSLMFQHTVAPGQWSKARELMAQDVPPGYTFYGGQIAVDSRNTLFVGGNFYSKIHGVSQGVAVLRSDEGRTWRTLAGKPVTCPVLYSEAVAVPHPPVESSPYLWTLICDSRDRIWCLAGPTATGDFPIYLTQWGEAGRETREIAPDFELAFPGWKAIDGNLCVDSAGRIHIVLTAVDVRQQQPDEMAFGHPSSEVFYLRAEGFSKEFEVVQVSPTDAEQPNWLASLSRPGPAQPVESPVIMWTRGKNHGKASCRNGTQTEVWCAFAQ